MLWTIVDFRLSGDRKMKLFKTVILLAFFSSLTLLYQNCSNKKGLDLTPNSSFTDDTQNCTILGDYNNGGIFGANISYAYNSSATYFLQTNLYKVDTGDYPTNVFSQNNITSNPYAFRYTATSSGSYVLVGVLYKNGNPVGDCRKSFSVSLNNVPTCTLSFSGNTQVGSTGTYSVGASSSGLLKIQLFKGTNQIDQSISSYAQTDLSLNRTFVTSDVGELTAKASLVVNNQTYNCNPNPLTQTIEPSSQNQNFTINMTGANCTIPQGSSTCTSNIHVSVALQPGTTDPTLVLFAKRSNGTYTAPISCFQGTKDFSISWITQDGYTFEVYKTNGTCNGQTKPSDGTLLKSLLIKGVPATTGSCPLQEINNCKLQATPISGTSGACDLNAGYTVGSCQYQCTTNGWSLNNNTCRKPGGGGGGGGGCSGHSSCQTP